MKLSGRLSSRSLDARLPAQVMYPCSCEMSIVNSSRHKRLHEVTEKLGFKNETAETKTEVKWVATQRLHDIGVGAWSISG